MKNYSKLILIVFSIALNIGFIVAAVFIYYNHPSTSHYSYLGYAKEIIKGLDLSVDQNKEVAICLDSFKKEISSTGHELHKLQNEMLVLLSAPGDLDEDRLNQIYSTQNHLFQKKHQIVRDHLLMMKKQLGDEKSTRFFSELLKKNKG